MKLQIHLMMEQVFWSEIYSYLTHTLRLSFSSSISLNEPELVSVHFALPMPRQILTEEDCIKFGSSFWKG